MSPERREEDTRAMIELVRWKRRKPWELAGVIVVAVTTIPVVMARNALRAIRSKSPENPKP